MIITVDLQDNILINGKRYVHLVKQNGVHGKTWKKWNPQQDKQVMKLYGEGKLSMEEIAGKMHRTVPAIVKRIQILQAKNAKKSGSSTTS